MFNIKLYLEKFKNFGQSERLFKEIIISSIREVTGVGLLNENVLIKNGEATLKVSPAVKNTVFIKKTAILEKIKEKTNQPLIDIK